MQRGGEARGDGVLVQRVPVGRIVGAAIGDDDGPRQMRSSPTSASAVSIAVNRRVPGSSEASPCRRLDRRNAQFERRRRVVQRFGGGCSAAAASAVSSARPSMVWLALSSISSRRHRIAVRATPDSASGRPAPPATRARPAAAATPPARPHQAEHEEQQDRRAERRQQPERQAGSKIRSCGAQFHLLPQPFEQHREYAPDRICTTPCRCT